jgi:hypothetical protein
MDTIGLFVVSAVAFGTVRSEAATGPVKATKRAAVTDIHANSSASALLRWAFGILLSSQSE